MVLSLNAYILLGGADFGGGVWDLIAAGRRQEEQRALVADAIGPIWEANHVWLILVVVLLFTSFPVAFAHLATELHVPITLVLIGIVLRGSAFTFRTYDSKRDRVQRRWGRIFSIASAATPVLLGICLGAVAGGQVPLDGTRSSLGFMERYITPWLFSPFAWCVGGLTIALFTFIAAVYLTVEARQHENVAMRETFRRNALGAQGVVVAAGVVTLVAARWETRELWDGLTHGRAAWIMVSVTTVSTALCMWSLFTRRFELARAAAAVEASFILWGWAWTQYPLLLPPDRTITALATAPRVLRLNLGVLVVGTLILLPSFVYLFWIFKREDAVDPLEAVDGANATGRR